MIWHVCNFCSAQYKTTAEKEHCESQGFTAQFQINQRIKLHAGNTEVFRVTGIICSVHTHIPLYQLESRACDNDNILMHSGKIWMHGGTFIPIDSSTSITYTLEDFSIVSIAEIDAALHPRQSQQLPPTPDMIQIH